MNLYYAMCKNGGAKPGWTTLAQVRLVEDNFHRFPSQYPASPSLAIGDPRSKKYYNSNYFQ